MKILVAASFSVDSIYHESKFKEIKQGGPAYFITKQLNFSNCAYTLCESTFAQVNIHISNKGERGTIVQNDEIRIQEDISQFEAIIISTISPNAINFGIINETPRYYFIDIQGFLRGDLSDLNNFAESLYRLKGKIFLKGTSDEYSKIKLKNLPQNIIFIETQGKEGVVVHQGVRSQKFAILTIVSSVDAIGAGDTFLASFTHWTVCKKQSIEQAINFATIDTSSFLLNKDKV